MPLDHQKNAYTFWWSDGITVLCLSSVFSAKIYSVPQRLTDCPREVVHLSTGGIRKKVAGRAGEAQAYRWLSSHADIYDTVQDDGAVVEIVKGQLNLTAASAYTAVDLEDWDTVLSCVETLHGQAKLLAGIVHKQGSLFTVLQAPPSELTAAWAALQVTIENTTIQRFQPTIILLPVKRTRPARVPTLLQLMQHPAPPARPHLLPLTVLSTRPDTGTTLHTAPIPAATACARTRTCPSLR